MSEGKPKPKTCGLCGEVGHNRRTCPQKEVEEVEEEVPTPSREVSPICSICGGAEMIPVPKAERRSFTGAEEYRACVCVEVKSRRRNINRAWRGLMRADRIEESPLIDYTEENLWITASNSTLRSHLKWVGIRRSSLWHFKVASDADLMNAWLVSAKVRGEEIYDPDVAMGTTSHLELEDLVRPPGLLVIVLGVKIAANKEMPNVLHETLMYRDHEDKPTWVCDQPSHPYNANHRAYSPFIEDLVEGWEQFTLLDEQPDSPRTTTSAGSSSSTKVVLGK